MNLQFFLAWEAASATQAGDGSVDADGQADGGELEGQPFMAAVTVGLSILIVECD